MSSSFIVGPNENESSSVMISASLNGIVSGCTKMSEKVYKDMLRDSPIQIRFRSRARPDFRPNLRHSLARGDRRHSVNIVQSSTLVEALKTAFACTIEL